MKISLGGIARVFTVLLVIASYGLTIWSGLTEETRRAITITERPGDTDSIRIVITVTGIDSVRGLLEERIRLIPQGRFAIDRNTPSSDLKVLINSIAGQQTIPLLKGVRIAPIDVATQLIGNANNYPFDVYNTNIDIFVTAPSRQSAVVLSDINPTVGIAPAGSELILGANDLNHSEPIPIVENIAASIPQWKFFGDVTHEEAQKMARTHLHIRRANNVIITSILTMVTMLILAISIMGMVLRVTALPGEMNLVPLSLCITLIFGLPALRSTQPNVPPIGVLGDYFSFIWANFIVSISGIALAWNWIARSRGQDKKKPAAP